MQKNSFGKKALSGWKLLAFLAMNMACFTKIDFGTEHGPDVPHETEVEPGKPHVEEPDDCTQKECPKEGVATLRFGISHTTLRFSPMAHGNHDGRSVTFSVAVSGFENEADANNVELMRLPLPQGFSPLFENSSYAEGTKTFRVHVNYAGQYFTEAPFTLQLSFTKLPQGYEYGGETPSIHVVVENGQANNPISLTQDNILAFNGYANNAGRTRHYRLVEDIVLEAPVPGQSNWARIGTSTSTFTGSLDGNGHTLSGLVIDNPDTNYQGLFGYIAAPAAIKNLGLIAFRVSARNRNYVGGLVGYSTGSSRVENSYATGNVEGNERVGGLVGENYGGQVENSYATGSVEGNGRVGGLLGENNMLGIVENSYATGSVNGDNRVGGLVGLNNRATVQNSYATGSVGGNNIVGGLVGSNEDLSSVVENCVALNPSVTQTADDTSTIGRVVGRSIIGGTLTNNHARDDMDIRFGVTDNSSGTKKTITNSSGGVDGQSVSAGSEADQHGNPSFWTTAPLSWDFNIWQWGPNNLPILRSAGGAQNHTLQ
jgi:hypothetical protein